jgi:hypothetical protein
MAGLARSSIALATVSLLIFCVGLFVPLELKPFYFGEEFIISPILSLLALAAALYAWWQATQRRTLHRLALTLAIVAFVATAGFTGLFLLAYSNCPGGAC